jgi:hypothetical protein
MGYFLCPFGESVPRKGNPFPGALSLGDGSYGGTIPNFFNR